MDKVTLYHSTRCPYSRRVRFVLEELLVDYEDVEVALDAPPAWYERMSPGGQVPCLVHGDVKLVESNTINEYLNEVFGGHLMPKDAATRARVRILMEWIDDEWMPAFREVERSAGEEGRPNAAAEADMEEALGGVSERMEAQSIWLVGKEITLADVAIATTLTELEGLGISLHPYPALRRLAAVLAERPACRGVATHPEGPVSR